ncbi:MAG: YkgJ family cysteine cluster protein [Dehalococcoidia bacterium]|nr:YkgJ family cysteine cluster protein [Dehalococcoidia bacterium]
MIEEEEVKRIAHFLKISHAQLITEFTDSRWPIRGKFLLRHQNGHCVFLSQNGKECLCTIHSVKPNACQEWEASAGRKECQTGLNKVWGVTTNEQGKISGDSLVLQSLLAHIRSISK